MLPAWVLCLDGALGQGRYDDNFMCQFGLEDAQVAGKIMPIRVFLEEISI